ncbi:MAG: calcium-binding protein, partial [Mycobacterium sp.]
SGGADNDTLFGGVDNDTLNGDAGADTLNGESGTDNLNGGTGSDTLNGGTGNDQLHGDADNDRLSGDAGADALWGGANDDFLLGGAGSDLLYGEAGSDTLNGNTDFDSLNGGAGDDWLVALDGAVDTLEGGTGRDSFWRDRVGDGIRDFAAADDVDNAVTRFANGADLTLDGDAIQRGLVPLLPTRNFSSNPLFASNGPTGSDVRVTGRAGTTWGAQLAALADGADAGVSAPDPSRSWLIRRAMVDFGDGTYGLKLGDSFYRVDGMLPGNAQGPSYAGFGAQNSIWVNIAMKGIVTALSEEGAIQPGSLNYGLLTDPGRMGPVTVFDIFGGNQQRAGGTTGGANSPINAMNLRGALDMFQRGYSYLTVSLADSGDSNVNQGFWQRGTLGRKFAAFYGIAPAQPPASTPMVYSVSAVETVNGQVTAVILRNPTGSDTGGSDVAVSYRDANANDGLVRITVAELLTSTKGPRLSWLSTGR